MNEFEKKLFEEEKEFKGYKRNEKKYKKFENLKSAAVMMKLSLGSDYPVEFGCSEGKNNEENASVWFYTELPEAFTDKAKGTFAMMVSLADDVVFSLPDEKNRIRVTFGIRKLWEGEYVD